MLRIIRTIKDTYLINYLSGQNVIPKYCFPVDVVQLDASHHGEQAKMLELDRDLRIALSEYAPDGKSVAAGKVWASRDIKRLPDRDWRRYRFAVCDHCQFYQRVLGETCDDVANGFRYCRRVRFVFGRGAGRRRFRFSASRFLSQCDFGFRPRRPFASSGSSDAAANACIDRPEGAGEARATARCAIGAPAQAKGCRWNGPCPITCRHSRAYPKMKTETFGGAAWHGRETGHNVIVGSPLINPLPAVSAAARAGPLFAAERKVPAPRPVPEEETTAR